MKYTAPRGTRDILPIEIPLWHFVEEKCRKIFDLYNYKEIRTPIFESTELFSRSIGASTDIINKEMYTFTDRGDRSLTLRPEETASVVRACIQNNLFQPDKLLKLYYLGPMFRYERPQAGRFRQFHQVGVEVFGSNEYLVDLEVIFLSLQLFSSLGMKDLELHINSVGCAECRPAYIQGLKAYFESVIGNMCADCQRRFEVNPLRVLDCKESNCQPFIEKAPACFDALCVPCKNQFNFLKESLEKSNELLSRFGFNWLINKRLVRGLDYYTKTTFEIISKSLGAQNAVCGGGRYDALVEKLGGKPTPAVGFALGLERVIEILTKTELRISRSGPELLVIALGEAARKEGFNLMKELRQNNIKADMDYFGKSLKAQMKIANQSGAKFVYIIGEEEIKGKSAVLKDMQTSEQKEVPFDKLIEALTAYEIPGRT